MAKEDPVFEMKFYESLLQKNPEFVEALQALGDLYTHEGFFEKGLEIDKRLAQLRPDDPYVLYNLACSYSLLEDNENAFSAIKKAVACGYEDFKFLSRDEDLVNLRNDKRFKSYFDALTKTRKTKYDARS